jgi:peptidoglycan/LPS O-acetylase OafA/YrhL
MTENGKKQESTRLVYLDNLRSFAIFLVICLHTAVTYSGMGSWYYIEKPQLKVNPLVYLVFGVFQSFTQAWFMGALFFISAVFVVKSLEKKGIAGFIKERFFRLGIPLLFYIFVVSPFIYFIALAQEAISWEYVKTSYMGYFTDISNLRSSGPLWFVGALLIFSAIYAVVRYFIPAKERDKNDFLKTRNLFGIILLIAVIAFIIRIWFPIGKAIFNFQLGYFSSYIVLFILGIMVGERKLIDEVSENKNIKLLPAGLGIGLPIWFIVMIFSNVFNGGTDFNGGLNWKSAAYAVWESLTAVSFSFGFISFFKKHLNKANKISKVLSENSFGIYVFHAPILVIITVLFREWITNPLIKWIIVVFITSIVCLIFVIIIRMVKPIKKILR